MVHFKPIDFAQTNFFSSLVLDYNEQKERLKPFYRFSNDNLGIHDARFVNYLNSSNQMVQERCKIEE